MLAHRFSELPYNERMGSLNARFNKLPIFLRATIFFVWIVVLGLVLSIISANPPGFFNAVLRGGVAFVLIYLFIGIGRAKRSN